jgi:hypothetical protein
MKPNQPPNGLPLYRLLTGPDDAEFCKRVSEAIMLGYMLYGSPTMTFDGSRIIVGQALVWHSA